jgi:hypothetical protein
VAMGDVMVLEKMNLHNPIKGYDTFVFSKLHFFFRHTANTPPTTNFEVITITATSHCASFFFCVYQQNQQTSHPTASIAKEVAERGSLQHGSKEI